MDKKKAFGELHSKDFDVGDIVEWSSWDDFQERWIQNYGVITEIKNEMRHNRLVSISKVLPVNSNTEMEHFSMSLRLVSRSTKDIDNVS
mgnify:CR=1 FL=1|tara:strand:+ start:610 stop:876 length:267 start_codon:yes stop_codon:yes gene_type:complete